MRREFVGTKDARAVKAPVFIMLLVLMLAVVDRSTAQGRALHVVKMGGVVDGFVRNASQGVGSRSFLPYIVFQFPGGSGHVPPGSPPYAAQHQQHQQRCPL